jgi:hypothetical protein
VGGTAVSVAAPAAVVAVAAAAVGASVAGAVVGASVAGAVVGATVAAAVVGATVAGSLVGAEVGLAAGLLQAAATKPRANSTLVLMCQNERFFFIGTGPPCLVKQ